MREKSLRASRPGGEKKAFFHAGEAGEKKRIPLYLMTAGGDIQIKITC